MIENDSKKKKKKMKIVEKNIVQYRHCRYLHEAHIQRWQEKRVGGEMSNISFPSTKQPWKKENYLLIPTQRTFPCRTASFLHWTDL